MIAARESRGVNDLGFCCRREDSRDYGSTLFSDLPTLPLLLIFTYSAAQLSRCTDGRDHISHSLSSRRGAYKIWQEFCFIAAYFGPSLRETPRLPKGIHLNPTLPCISKR